jgi:hypothetical protein
MNNGDHTMFQILVKKHNNEVVARLSTSREYGSKDVIGSSYIGILWPHQESSQHLSYLIQSVKSLKILKYNTQ